MNRLSKTVREDPLCRHARREALWIVALWLLAMVYTCSACYLFGYASHPPDPTSTGPAIGAWVGPLPSWDRRGESLTFPLGLGIPDWVLYGVVAPWVVSTLATLYFCYAVYREDDLGEDAATEDDP